MTVTVDSVIKTYMKLRTQKEVIEAEAKDKGGYRQGEDAQDRGVAQGQG